MNKRGISPVIATVLLVAMVVVIALIIFLWFRNIGGEQCEKFGEACELVCDKVEFDYSYSSGTLYLSNIGNTPIYKMRIKITEAGGSNQVYLKDIASNWPSSGLNQGGTFSGDISSEVSGATKITLIPILRGSGEDGDQDYVCEGRFEQDIDL